MANEKIVENKKVTLSALKKMIDSIETSFGDIEVGTTNGKNRAVINPVNVTVGFTGTNPILIID